MADKKIIDYLTLLGLSKQQIAVFFFLLKNNTCSVLDISRGLKTGRTKLYPLLEDLSRKQLIISNNRHYGTTYEAAPLSSIEYLIHEQEAKSQALKISLPAVIAGLEKFKSAPLTGSKVVEYKGIEGLKQINFNLTGADREYRVFEIANLDQYQGIPRYYAEKLRRIQLDKKITSYDLTNNPNWNIDTSIKGYRKVSRARYIDPKIFEIKFESYIYNGCVAMLNYDSRDIFGVEIHNSSLAEQQKQLFDLIWDMGSDL